MKLDHQYGNKIKSPLAMKPIYLLKKELNSFEISFLKINRGHMANLIIITYSCTFKSMKYQAIVPVSVSIFSSEFNHSSILDFLQNTATEKSSLKSN